mgnify:FL=1|jgi:uncharacterized protein YndB with AHSA1/START domain
MFKIKVERIVKAPIERVFEAISDHANYGLYPSVGMAHLLSEGDQERNGKGALRTVETGVFKVWERITAFERPVHMQYQIERAKPIKMDHYKGIIDLKELGDGTTHVTWVSEGHMAVPLIGQFLDSKMQKQGTSVFHSMLKSIESR